MYIVLYIDHFLKKMHYECKMIRY